MNARTSQLFPVLLMLGLALGTLWLERLVQLPAPNNRDALRHDPDFLVYHFTLTRINQAGRADSSLTATKMLHYPDDESTQVEQPRVVQQRENAPPVNVTAERGTLTKDGEEIHVAGNVVITRAPTDGRPELRVDTSYLEIRPGPETAHTPEAVTITQGSSTLYGVGMDVNNKTREFALHSLVKGSFRRTPGAQ